MKFPYQKLPVHQSPDPSTPRIARPYIPVYLHGEKQSTPSPYYAMLDSGADNVLFPSDLAKEVGIADIKTGKGPFSTIGIAGQRAATYFHNLKVQVQGDSRQLPVMVGFSDNIIIPLLGRSFFKHFKEVVFNEEKERVELKPSS
ncbi:MAG: clan AA aspartic protease [Candidatus Liptonbacteria bacterium]|nr:clan AA aspartic protease [Candidatus Liptonbacteria bacterium]